MPYVLLGTAIVLEIIATTLLKSSEGFTKLLPAVFCILFCTYAFKPRINYILCFFIFSKALNSINLGVAYATWCAGGIVATAVISAAVFGEKLNWIGITGIVLIVTGCILLNLFGSLNH